MPGRYFLRALSEASVVFNTWRKTEGKDSVTRVKNEPSAQGLATASRLVLKLNYRCNTFAGDTGINFPQSIQDWEGKVGGTTEKIR